MTDMMLRLQRGPDGQPTGHLRTGSGQVIEFTGWLDLIRVLEDQLPEADPRADS
jgi:hypothetical protein